MHVHQLNHIAFVFFKWHKTSWPNLYAVVESHKPKWRSTMQHMRQSSVTRRTTPTMSSVRGWLQDRGGVNDYVLYYNFNSQRTRRIDLYHSTTVRPCQRPEFAMETLDKALQHTLWSSISLMTNRKEQCSCIKLVLLPRTYLTRFPRQEKTSTKKLDECFSRLWDISVPSAAQAPGETVEQFTTRLQN